MERFKDYLKLRLSDVSFNHRYHDNCSICPTTVEIIKSIDLSDDTVTEIAEKSGVDEESITDLRDADYCRVDSVRKLVAFFNLPPPDTCLKERGLKKPQDVV